MRRVAIQGQPGCYHDIASREFFSGEAVELVCCATFEDVFASLSADPSMNALLAIENTIAGSLLHNYELLRESGARVIGEHKVHIEHSLMCLPEDDWSTLSAVDSHPVALQQCRRFLSKHPELMVCEAEDTAGSAEAIRKQSLRGRAAICHRSVASLYDMKILAEGIHDNPHNYTRFLVLESDARATEESTSELRSAPSPLSQAPNKSSIVFSLPHSEGSLSQVLTILSFYGINMTKIQSLPIIGHEWEYLFYVDVTFTDRTRYRQSIDAIKPLIKELKILGEYRAAE